jgi:hypothetical protein
VDKQRFPDADLDLVEYIHSNDSINIEAERGEPF